MKYNCTYCPSVFYSKEDCLQHVESHLRQECSYSKSNRSQYRSHSRSPVRNNKKDQVFGYEPIGWEDRTYSHLDYFNSDLHLLIDSEGFSARPLINDGFSFMWAGVRSTKGILPSQNPVWFEVRISKNLAVGPRLVEESCTHVVRVGWSTNSSGMLLGEEKDSYGYGGTAKASENNKYLHYGIEFGEGDVVASILKLDGSKTCISYAVNGKSMGVCFDVERSSQSPLFPHIFTKNCSFEVNFGQRSCWYPEAAGNDALLIDKAPASLMRRGQLPPEKREDCTVLMMVGLPGAGKSHWAEKYSQEMHHEKRYTLLGTNTLIDRFKIVGLPRNRNYSGRWDMLIEKSTNCLNTLLKMAAHRKRNFIIDQTNVYATARRRKLASFSGFHHVAVCIVPQHEDWLRRCELQKKLEGKDVPASAFVEMKANFVLPSAGDGCFDEVWWPELNQGTAALLVQRYNLEGMRDKASGGDHADNFCKPRGFGADAAAGVNFDSRAALPQPRNQRETGPPRSDYGYMGDVSVNYESAANRNCSNRSGTSYHYRNKNSQNSGSAISVDAGDDVYTGSGTGCTVAYRQTANGDRGGANNYGGSASGYGSSSRNYGGSASGFVNSASGYGNSASNLGNSAIGYGVSANNYGGSASSYRNSASCDGGSTSSYRDSVSNYEGSVSSYGGSVSSYGGSASSYGGSACSYGGSACSYGGSAGYNRGGGCGNRGHVRY